MDSRAGALIRALSLSPHPEGGYYREIWRSDASVEPADRRGLRAALTTIYFLLPAGAVSRWHRVRSDEVWQHVEGAPLELVTVPPTHDRVERILLGSFEAQSVPVHVVPAEWWQGARSQGAYTLVVCTVGPGFDFSDFEMLSDDSARVDAFCRALPAAAGFA